MKKLIKYLKNNNLSYRQFSNITGIDYTLICKYCTGARSANLKNAYIIEHHTSGKVSIYDWIDKKWIK